MATVLTLKQADFSGAGLPNVKPFVATDALNFAYDFTDRPSFLTDLSGNNRNLVPWKLDWVADSKEQSDLAIVREGSGIRVEGYLDTQFPLFDIPRDGSMQFTVMIAGGASGLKGMDQSLTGLIDFGTYIGPDYTFNLEVSSYWGVGARIEYGSINLFQGLDNETDKVVIFLTFDGDNWTINVPTLNATLTKTSAELDILDDPMDYARQLPNVVMGAYRHDTGVSSGFPTLYQGAMWDRVLTAEEMQEQYNRTRNQHPGVGL